MTDAEVQRSIQIEHQGDRIIFRLCGFPEGWSLHEPSIVDPSYLGLSALYADLMKVLGWVRAAQNAEENVAEALFDAALVRYCTCFDKNSSRTRIKRLRPQDIFTADDDLLAHSKLVKLRNKFVAHDDDLHPNRSAAVLLDDQRRAVEMYGLELTSRSDGWLVSPKLEELATIAFDWVTAKRNAVAAAMLEGFNGPGTEQARQNTRSDGVFSIRIVDEEPGPSLT